jgi:hypothetical protein
MGKYNQRMRNEYKYSIILGKFIIQLLLLQGIHCSLQCDSHRGLFNFIPKSLLFWNSHRCRSVRLSIHQICHQNIFLLLLRHHFCWILFSQIILLILTTNVRSKKKVVVVLYLHWFVCRGRGCWLIILSQVIRWFQSSFIKAMNTCEGDII